LLLMKCGHDLEKTINTNFDKQISNGRS